MPTDSFESPLTLAACGGHVDLAMLLIERGANIEEVNDEGYTPLMEAAREGHEEMVALLLSQGKLCLSFHLEYNVYLLYICWMWRPAASAKCGLSLLFLVSAGKSQDISFIKLWFHNFLSSFYAVCAIDAYVMCN